jgi:hypothetical protein
MDTAEWYTIGTETFVMNTPPEARMPRTKKQPRRLRYQIANLASIIGWLLAMAATLLIIVGILTRAEQTYPLFAAIPVGLGFALVQAAVVRPPQMLLGRMLLVCGGLWLIIAALDALRPDAPAIADAVWMASLLMFVVIGSYAYPSPVLQAPLPLHNIRRMVIAGFGGILGMYIGFLLLAALLVIPLSVEWYSFTSVGAVIWPVVFLLRFFDSRHRPLQGGVHICPSCGLRNIIERQTCKRCGVRFI